MAAGIGWNGGGGSDMAVCSTKSEKRTPMVHQAIESLSSRVDVLDSAITKLRETLSCAMDDSPRPTNGDGCSDPKAPYRKCSVSDGIFQQRDRVEALIHQINDVLDRIEL
jgi:hypothetical protein